MKLRPEQIHVPAGRKPRRDAAMTALLYLIVGAVTAVASPEVARGPGRVFALYLTAVLPVAVASTLVHELGHASLGGLAGCRIFWVYLGAGELALAREWKGVRFVLQQVPLTGATMAGMPPGVRFPRLAAAAFVAGGPLANALVALSAFALLDFAREIPALWVLAQLVLVVNVVLAVANTVPSRRRRPAPDRPTARTGYFFSASSPAAES